MSDEQAFCEKCGYTAPVVSAATGGFLFCAVCDARDRARDFRTERDEARAELSRLRAELADMKPVRGCLPEQSCGMSGFNSPGQRIPPLCFHRELNNAEADQVRELYSAVVAVLNELDGLRSDCKRKDEAIQAARNSFAFIAREAGGGRHGPECRCSFCKIGQEATDQIASLTAALADSDTPKGDTDHV